MGSGVVVVPWPFLVVTVGCPVPVTCLEVVSSKVCVATVRVGAAVAGLVV